MTRKRMTIRGVDEDAWAMLVEVRKISRTQTGALISEALRYWYDNLEIAEEEMESADGGLGAQDRSSTSMPFFMT